MANNFIVVAMLLCYVHLVHPQSPQMKSACLKAETIHSSQQFCMLYYPEFKKLPDSPSLAVPIKLVNATKYDGCSELGVRYDREAALTIATNACAVEKTIVNFNKANFAALIMLSSKPYFDQFNVNETRDLDMVVGFVSNATTNALLNLFSTGGDIKVSMYSTDEVAFDYSLVVIWVIAVFTVAVGAYWSGKVRLELFILEQHQRGQDCRFLNGGNGFQENKISQSGSLQTYSDAVRQPPQEESSLDVSPLLVSLFVVCMGAMLILLYFFFQYLVYFIIGMFALASVTSLIGVLEPIVDRIPIGTTKIPRKLLPCFYSSLQIRHLFLILFSIGVTTAWLVFRLEPWSWALQDLLGVAFSLNMLRSLRLPNLLICSVLLILLFFYDIFFVFVTPFLTMKGESVMVEVARGTADTQEQLPMVLRVPHLGFEPLPACLSLYSVLGFGDILVPGLLVSYCHAFDLLHQTRPGRLYYTVSTICYGVGLMVTFVALYFMRTAQPALLYLVPCTLIPVVLIALCRGELRAMWKGNFHNSPVNVNGNSQPHPLPNNSVLPPYGATETDPAPIYQTDPALIPN